MFRIGLWVWPEQLSVGGCQWELGEKTLSGQLQRRLLLLKSLLFPFLIQKPHGLYKKTAEMVSLILHAVFFSPSVFYPTWKVKACWKLFLLSKMKYLWRGGVWRKIQYIILKTYWHYSYYYFLCWNGINDVCICTYYTYGNTEYSNTI